MSNYLASHSDTEKKIVMICDDERDLLELFGKAIKSKHNAHNSKLPLSKFNRDVVDRSLKCKVFKS
jgi:hypothetical protein